MKMKMMMKMINNFKLKIAHKIHLVHELMYDGYDKAIKYKSEDDIEFVMAIQYKDLELVIDDLIKELYSIK